MVACRIKDFQKRCKTQHYTRCRECLVTSCELHGLECLLKHLCVGASQPRIRTSSLVNVLRQSLLSASRHQNRWQTVKQIWRWRRLQQLMDPQPWKRHVSIFPISHYYISVVFILLSVIGYIFRSFTSSRYAFCGTNYLSHCRTIPATISTTNVGLQQQREPQNFNIWVTWHRRSRGS